MIEIQDLKKLSTFYPSQWEAHTATGELVYIRYKHGELSAGIDQGDGQSPTLFCESVGEKHGFDMDTEEMKAHLAGVCRFVDGSA
jgi:hypothetical protein